MVSNGTDGSGWDVALNGTHANTESWPSLQPGMTQVARDSGLARGGLYNALSGDRIPSFDTALKVMSGGGLQLHARSV